MNHTSPSPFSAAGQLRWSGARHHADASLALACLILGARLRGPEADLLHELVTPRTYCRGLERLEW